MALAGKEPRCRHLQHALFVLFLRQPAAGLRIMPTRGGTPGGANPKIFELRAPNIRSFRQAETPCRATYAAEPTVLSPYGSPRSKTGPCLPVSPGTAGRPAPARTSPPA